MEYSTFYNNKLYKLFIRIEYSTSIFYSNKLYYKLFIGTEYFVFYSNNKSILFITINFLYSNKIL